MTTRTVMPPENFTELVRQIQEVVKTLYIGNGQKAILPRMEGIENLLKNAAETTEKTATALMESNVRYDERFDRLDKAIMELTISVQEHHKSLHLKDLLKSAKAWTVGFIAFSVFHAGAEYIQANGGSWIEIILKYLGLK